MQRQIKQTLTPHSIIVCLFVAELNTRFPLSNQRKFKHYTECSFRKLNTMKIYVVCNSLRKKSAKMIMMIQDYRNW